MSGAHNRRNSLHCIQTGLSLFTKGIGAGEGGGGGKGGHEIHHKQEYFHSIKRYRLGSTFGRVSSRHIKFVPS